jgi:hypothetical protein
LNKIRRTGSRTADIVDAVLTSEPLRASHIFDDEQLNALQAQALVVW